MRRSRRPTSPLPSLLLLALAGCGSVDRVESGAPLPETTYRLEAGALLGPDTLGSGPTRVRLEVDAGPLDQVTLVRLEDGHTVEEFLQVLDVAHPAFWGHFAGGPGLAMPGRPAEGVVFLTPGQWLALAFDTGPGGFPRVRHQASRPLVVVPGPEASPPSAPYRLNMYDFGFLISGPLLPGENTIEVHNLAPQRHEAILARLEEGQSAAELANWLLARRRGEPVGEPPGELLSGVAAMSQDQMVLWTVTVRPGRHVIFCLLAEDADGRSHLEHGHLQEFEVAESVDALAPSPS